MPAVSTMSLISMVVTISRRSWCERISGVNRSRSGVGKYSGSLDANTSWSGSSVASSSSLSPSLTCAINVASSGEVSPMPASVRR